MGDRKSGIQFTGLHAAPFALFWLQVQASIEQKVGEQVHVVQPKQLRAGFV